MGDIVNNPSADALSERVRRVEAAWLRPSRAQPAPKFWHDLAVRRALIDIYGCATLDDARAQVEAVFGRERAPSRSAIGRFWLSLDPILAQR